MLGRPSKYNKVIADKICEQLANSSQSIHKISKINKVSVRSVMRWLEVNEEFRQQYARARDLQASFLAEEIIAIADKCRQGKKTVTKVSKDGAFSEETIGDMVERSRLMIDARKWLASKLAPKKYGDKIDVTSSGESVKTIVFDIIPKKDAPPKAE